MSMQAVSLEFRRSQSVQWQEHYVEHLQQRLRRTRTYLQSAPRETLRKHTASFISLLNEARRYPAIQSETLALIAVLHPWPLRWGYGTSWVSQLLFALENTRQKTLQAVYLNDLADIHLAVGEFDQAVAASQKVLSMRRANQHQRARACRNLFTTYRSLGQPDEADALIERWAASFAAHQPAEDIAPDLAAGWLRFNQCRLERLREQGKPQAALDLLEKMIWLDQKMDSPDTALTADLYTHRSTLLWARGAFHRSVHDLQEAIAGYRSIDDIFNAESLQSNLGLIYWSMGALDKAEIALQTAIRFYRKSGADQLLTYDLGNMGLVHFSRGNLEAASKWTREHIQHAKKINFYSEYNRGRRNLGSILYHLGKYEEALAEINFSLEYRQARGSRDAYGLDVLCIATCEHALGRQEQAIKNVQEVLDWARRDSFSGLEQIALRCLAFLLPPGEGAIYLRHSLGLARVQERRLEEAACLLMLARTLPSREEQESCWLQGVDLLHDMGAAAWLKDQTPENPPFLPLSL